MADGLAARGTFNDQIASLERYTAAERRRLELAQWPDELSGRSDRADDLYATGQILDSARLQRLTNLVDLYRALGGGWLERTGQQ